MALPEEARMNWEDTVKCWEELENYSEDKDLINVQAKISFKAGEEAEREKWLKKDKLQFCERHKLYHADTCCDCMVEIGRREVVETLMATVDYECEDENGSLCISFWFSPEGWKAKLKKWGIKDER